MPRSKKYPGSVRMSVASKCLPDKDLSLVFSGSGNALRTLDSGAEWRLQAAGGVSNGNR